MFHAIYFEFLTSSSSFRTCVLCLSNICLRDRCPALIPFFRGFSWRPCCIRFFEFSYAWQSLFGHSIYVVSPFPSSGSRPPYDVLHAAAVSYIGVPLVIMQCISHYLSQDFHFCCSHRRLVTVLSALVSIAYVLIGLTHVLHIRTLLSFLKYLFLHVMSVRYPDIIDALVVCDFTSFRFLLLVMSTSRYLNFITCSTFWLLTASLHLFLVFL